MRRQASAATKNVSIAWTGNWVRAGSYERGGDNQTVVATALEAANQTITLVARDTTSLLVVDLGMQHIPYQGYPNQRMDMILNDSWTAKARYEKQFGWGKLTAKAFYHDVHHEMDSLAERTPLVTVHVHQWPGKIASCAACILLATCFLVGMKPIAIAVSRQHFEQVLSQTNWTAMGRCGP